MKKIVFVCGTNSTNSQKIVNFISYQGLHPILTSNPDEVDQFGRLSKKVILIFHEIKFAHKFIQDNSSTWENCYDVLNIFLTNKPDDTQLEILKNLNINIWPTNQAKNLINHIKEFLNSDHSLTDTNIDEIEFGVNITPSGENDDA